MTGCIEPRFDLHARRYGEIISADLEDGPYHERQCGECPYGHHCCDLVVMTTPAEVAGILEWLSRTLKDPAPLVRAIQLRASVLVDHFKKFGSDQNAAISAWATKGLKCVFYDPDLRGGAGGCSIYPVRPVACRRVFGDGDCADGKGMHSAPDTSEVLNARVARFKIHPDLAQNVCEMTTLVSRMASGENQVYVDEQFYQQDPADLTDDQVIFGLAGAPIRNPVALEKADGSP